MCRDPKEQGLPGRDRNNGRGHERRSIPSGKESLCDHRKASKEKVRCAVSRGGMGGLCEAERALNFILRELWGTTVEWCKSQEAGREVRSQV